MRSRRGAFRRSSRGPKRKTDWGRAFGGIEASQVNAGTIGVFATWLKYPADVIQAQPPGTDNVEPEDYTLVKSRLTSSHLIFATLSENQGVICNVADGIIVWEQANSDDPDPDTVPLPIQEGNADWIIHRWRNAQGVNASGFTLGVQFISPQPGYELEEWSRAQRKLSSMQGLLYVAQCENVGTTNVFWQADFFYRCLFKLP